MAAFAAGSCVANAQEDGGQIPRKGPFTDSLRARKQIGVHLPGCLELVNQPPVPFAEQPVIHKRGQQARVFSRTGQIKNPLF
jgi:hypothetical protein